MPYRIFISHNYGDFRIVKQIVHDAKSIGIDAYAYEYDSQPGYRIADKVQRRIQECHALVAVLTKNGLSSAYVNQEIGMAMDKQKIVIPIVEKGIPTSKLGMLEGIEHITFDRRNLLGTRTALAKYLYNLKLVKEKSDRNLIIALGVLALMFFMGGKK